MPARRKSVIAFTTTGAPCFAVDMAAHNFDSERLWHNLVKWRRLQYPMGCATDPVPHLREAGLCGSHAYSITDARVVRTTAGSERLLRIRNPHGVGEWNGDWSDKSAKWAQLIDADPTMVKRTGDDDGTFWIDYTHFMMGYSRVDVCVRCRAGASVARCVSTRRGVDPKDQTNKD